MRDGKNYYLLCVLNEFDIEMVKLSQEKKPFCKLFSCHKYTEKVHEVITDGYIDKGDTLKLIHSKAPYEGDKIYLQARNIFEAGTKFKKFFEAQNKIENEKEKIESDSQLP